MDHARHTPLSWSERFGLRPVGRTLAQAKLVFFGDPSVPPSRFDRTSLDLFTPRMSIATWRGVRVLGRRVPIVNLVNRTPTPITDGWSVRVTQVRDFRGRALTYDSHNGTDLVLPPGTVVVAAAPGRVVAIRQEWNRGGLKLYLDHGHGLMTSSNHLGRTLVSVGDVVDRAQPVALSAYSGADGFLTFPWVAPHVHYNVILRGQLVDPFAEDGEVPLWRADNAPRPLHGVVDDRFVPTVFDAARVARALDACSDARVREALAKEPDVTLRGFGVLLESTVYPTRFADDVGAILYDDDPPRAARLDLPVRADDFDGIAFADDEGLR